MPKGIAFCRLLADFVEKSRKSIVVANLLKYQRHLRLTFIAAADRFRTRSVESEVDDEAPSRPNLKTAPTALKKLDRVNTPTFSTESAPSDGYRNAAIRALSGEKQT